MNKFGQYFEHLMEQFTKFSGAKLKETFLFGGNS
jgi:hypothetical protein